MSVNLVASFHLERVISEDARAKSINLLGSCTEEDGTEHPALLLLEKTHFTRAFAEALRDGGPTSVFERLASIGQNDVYTWAFGWERDAAHGEAQSKLTLICPASPEAIAKYSAQERVMVVETPALYAEVTRPWIASMPPSKTTWVRNILGGTSERESVLYRDEDPESGFVLVPDLKWDRRTLSSLYLMAIANDGRLTNMRDLTADRIPLLRKILHAVARVAHEVYGVPDASADGTMGSLRCFIHYMPTYFHFHVHILSVNYISHPGAIVGQAHLVDDIISLLELGVDFKKLTLGYALTDGHPLLCALKKASSA
ncbi:5'-(N(7)-methyl 5'-triphosphoguanosine)-[mRNA] diphosphatase [Malassezia sp. CBS 17886]|nr:5'-(N(7)-methyl 5'-triphosphoguanosine)-[mRNA] diphosphatase [Malassezia sp. CBS 17886]